MSFGITSCRPIYIPEFIADRPFLFKIIDKKSSLVYFCGCFVK